MEDMLEYANTHKKTCYFLGAEAKVNHALVKKVKMDYPDLIIGGSHHGFFELNDASIVEDVKNSNADIIFVALGFPRQEKDRKSTRLNSSHVAISYAVFCLKKKKKAHCKYQ